MILDGLLREIKFSGNLFVGEASSQKRDKLPLASRESGQRRRADFRALLLVLSDIFEEIAAQARGAHGLAGSDGSHALDDIVCGSILQDAACNPSANSLEEHVFRLFHPYKQNLLLRMAMAEVAELLGTVQQVRRRVQQKYVGLFQCTPVELGGVGAAHARDLEVRTFFQDAGERFAMQTIVREYIDTDTSFRCQRPSSGQPRPSRPSSDVSR